MTNSELASLAPTFLPGEKRQDGALIKWDECDYQTFYWLKMLREQLGSPLVIIRETHVHRTGPPKPWDATAVDFTVPAKPLARVFLELTRFPHLSWGLYTGGSAHLDRRVYDVAKGELPARWLGIRPQQRKLFEEFGLGHLLAKGSAEAGKRWLYLAWSGDRAFEALALVVRLADGDDAA